MSGPYSQSRTLEDVLVQAVRANGGSVAGVRSFVRKWRSLGESNPSFQIENLTS